MEIALKLEMETEQSRIENSAEAMSAVEMVREMLARYHRESLASQEKAEEIYYAIEEADRTLTFLRRMKDVSGQTVHR